MADPRPTPDDVIVIGGGPMGSFAAARMAAAGLRVAVFEKDTTPGQATVCAGGMHVDVARFIDLPENAVERQLCRLRIGNGRRLRETVFRDTTYVTVRRQQFDACLADRARQAGVDFHLGTRVTAAAPDTGRVTYQRGADSSSATARFLVFADGPLSLARRLPGLQPAAVPPRHVALQYELDAPENDYAALEFHVNVEHNPCGYAWVFPWRDRLAVGIGRPSGVAGLPLVRVLDEWISGREDLRGRRVLRRQGGLIPAAPAPVLQHGRALLIGDAAGMANPITGGGYACGFRSAALAAEVCIAATRHADPAAAETALAAYTPRLRATTHYWVVAAGSRILRAALLVHRRTGVCLFPALLSGYIRLVHLAMRLGGRLA